MEQIPLVAQKRTILGRKVKNLRKQGFIPAHVFGHKVPTVHVQVKTIDFTKVFEKAGETGIVDLTIDGSTNTDSSTHQSATKRGTKSQHPVLIRNVQIHPVTDEPLHIDFYQVNLSEKVKVNVPLEVVGDAPAVGKKIGLLLTPLAEVEIEALPQDILDKIEVDITGLENIADEIKVKDLKVDKTKIEVLTDEDLVVAQIGALVTKEMEAVEAEIEAEQAEAAAEVAAPVPAEVAEGAEAAPSEEKAPEAAPPQTKDETSAPESAKPKSEK